AELAGRGAGVDVHFADAVDPLLEGADEIVHLGGGTFHDQFDAAVGQVADITANVVAQREVLGSVAEADALHAARKIAGAAAGGPTLAISDSSITIPVPSAMILHGGCNGTT